VNIVTLAWGYVVLMAALVEASGPEGSILGALVTVLLYGGLPLAVLSYISGAGRRRRAARAASAGPATPTSDRVDPGGGGLPAGEALAPVRKEA